MSTKTATRPNLGLIPPPGSVPCPHCGKTGMFWIPCHRGVSTLCEADERPHLCKGNYFSEKRRKSQNKSTSAV